jgi:hypothetical protein
MLRRVPAEKLDREGLPVARIDPCHLQQCHLRDAGLRGSGIVDQGVDGRRFRILEQVAAE